jgi:hypothetical protein
VLGVLLVPETDTSLRLLWVGTAAAFGVAGVAVAGIFVVYKVAGFQGVRVAADVIIGFLIGLFLGFALMLVFGIGWWGMMAVPNGVLVPILLRGRPRISTQNRAPSEANGSGS